MMLYSIHQQIKETPAINYSSAKRIIAYRQDYNPPVKDSNGLFDRHTLDNLLKGFSGQKYLYCITMDRFGRFH